MLIFFLSDSSSSLKLKFSFLISEITTVISPFLEKLIFDNSETQATLVLIFPDYKTFKKDHNNLAGPIIDSFKEQGLKVDLNDGEVLGATAVSSNFLETLTKEATFYKTD